MMESGSDRLDTGKKNKGLKNWKGAVGLGLIVLLLAGGFWGLGGMDFFARSVQAEGIVIQAMEADGLGVSPQSGFLLTSPEPLPEKWVKEALQIQPAVSFDLKKTDGGKGYQILLEADLQPNTVYTLSIDPSKVGNERQSWAFQTKASFRIMRSLPMDKSTYVPLNTGIEILLSHDNFVLAEAEKAFRISPRVEGTFEKHGRTLVFVPKALTPSTLYQVTLQQGLGLLESAEVLQQDFNFSFETAPEGQNPSPLAFDMDTDLTEFRTGEPPIFQVYFNAPSFFDKTGTSSNVLPSLQIDLYRYDNKEEFQASLAKRDEIPRWSYLSWNSYREALNPQQKIASYQTSFFKANDYSYYIHFPEELPLGQYVAEMKAGDTTRQVWFQVSDLAVFAAQEEENTLFWVNDLKTQAPVREAQVKIAAKNISAGTDENGVALIAAKLLGSVREYAWIQKDQQEVLIPLQAKPEWFGSGLDPRNYWKYLYLDRELYQPQDQIHFWGVLAGRNKGVPQPQELTMELWNGNGVFYPDGMENSPILTQRVPVQDLTYQGQLNLPVLQPGPYYLQVKVEDRVLLSRGFSVETYQKPTYQLSLNSDKKAVFAGEAVSFGLKASFFEGTPVPALLLNYYLDNTEKALTTDARGEGKIRYMAMADLNEYAAYDMKVLSVTSVWPEVGPITQSQELMVFPSQVALTGEASAKGEQYTLQASLRMVDLQAIQQGQPLLGENYLRAQVPGAPVVGTLYEEIWTPVEQGQKYDFIQKQWVKEYYYEYSTKQVQKVNLTTDAQGEIHYTGKIEAKKSYYMVLSAKDTQGREVKKRIQVLGKGYSNPGYSYYFLQVAREQEGFLPGEEAILRFMKNEGVLVPEGKKILYVKGKKTIESYLLSDQGEVRFPFRQEDIPNLNVMGIYFDGRTYRETSATSVPYQQKEKELKVELTTDQQNYRPGDNVKLSLKVLDGNNRPVAGAQVNLNLVDEALYQLRDQKVTFLHSLYRDVVSLQLVTSKTHRQADFGGGAEQGGEGGSERKDFRDTVLFRQLVTDRQGQAQIEFSLPDNLTSWRVTYHAFSKELYAGSGTGKIPVRLPFFVDMAHQATYRAGDQPTVLLRSFGEKLSAQSPVSFSMTLQSGQERESQSQKNSTAFTSLDWSLPVLQEGTYQLTVQGQSQGLADQLTREIQVVSSYQQRTVTGLETLREGLVPTGSATEPTTLAFSDAEKSLYLQGLYGLASQHGSRLEQKLARQEAQKLLQQYFPDQQNGVQQEPQSLLLYQKQDGGIAILPYGESELALSAMVAASTSGTFDASALRGYFYRMLEEAKGVEERSQAYLGLAALREPVLLSIKRELQVADLAPSVQINLALALLELGDGAYAAERYQVLFNQYKEDLGTSMRIKVGKSQDEILAATTQMALLAARLDQPDKGKLTRYLLDNPGKEILNLVEQVQIFQYHLKYMNSAPVRFTYELKGEKFQKTLQGQENFQITLLPADLDQIRFSGLEGHIGLISQYRTSIKPGEKGQAEGLAITRSYQAGGKTTTTLPRTALVRVVLRYQISDPAPKGIYELIDVLPSGLTAVRQPWQFGVAPTGDWTLPDEINGQRVVFRVDPARKELTYLARVVSPGTYTAEGPLLSNINDSKIYLSGEADQVVIP